MLSPQSNSKVKSYCRRKQQKNSKTESPSEFNPVGCFLFLTVHSLSWLISFIFTISSSVQPQSPLNSFSGTIEITFPHPFSRLCIVSDCPCAWFSFFIDIHMISLFLPEVRRAFALYTLISFYQIYILTPYYEIKQKIKVTHSAVKSCLGKFIIYIVVIEKSYIMKLDIFLAYS